MRIWIAAAAAALFVLAWIQSSALKPESQRGILQINPPTPYIHYSPASSPRGRVLVVHGLDASKEIMQLLSAGLADGGFEVYNIDLPGHGDSSVGFEATFAQQAIRNVLEKLGNDTIVVGHSLGAGLLLDLAATEHFSTIVLLSPPPTPLEEIHAGRILVLSGEFDVPRIRTFAPVLADIGGPHLEWWRLTWAGHSSAIFNPIHIRRIVEWLGGDGRNTRTLARLIWIGVMFISAVIGGLAMLKGRALEPLEILIPNLIVRYVLACSVALLVLRIGLPMGWLKIFAADYLVSFLLLTGLLLWVQGTGSLQLNAVAITKAATAAVFVIVILGFIASGQLLHLRLSNGRWWRFPCIVFSTLPLLAFDELMIRRIYPRWKSVAVAIVTRALLGSFLLIGILLLNRHDAFLVLIAHLMVLFWIAIWFGTDVIHRHTQNAFAAALFAALLQGWAFAAWFVTI